MHPADSYYAPEDQSALDASLVAELSIDQHRQDGPSEPAECHAWWSKDASHKYWRIYGGEMEIRKYFGRKARENRCRDITSPSTDSSSPDIENGGTGHQSKKYGEEWSTDTHCPIGRRLNLDFGLGGMLSSPTTRPCEPKDDAAYEVKCNPPG